jgi:nucleoside 2-deoxyribosyltransferase
MKKIYFAGPWFTAAQAEREQRLIKRLRELGFDVFSPRESSNITGSFADPAVQKATFEGNIVNIDSCDILFAVTDGKQGTCTEPDKTGQPMQAIDAGTMVEVGYAYRMRRESGKKPIMVYYAETLKNGQFNLMLAQSADIVISGETAFEDLDKLPEWIENNTKVSFNGMIE